ncbi:MAG TPA: hypothetical protein VFG84_10535 [Gemmatimonadaceae bacterium]|nr:hypothetical protein [Gemmatimonadaceae bacterium]
MNQIASRNRVWRTAVLLTFVLPFVPLSLGAQSDADDADASRNWRARVMGGVYRDGFDVGADGDRVGKLLGVRLLRDLPDDAASGLIYGLAFDLGVTHDVASHADPNRIVSGYLWDILMADIGVARRMQSVTLRAGVRTGVASRYRTREGEVGNPPRLPAGTMASRRQFGPVAGGVVGLALPTGSRLQFEVEAVAYAMRVQESTKVLPALLAGLSWRL